MQEAACSGWIEAWSSRSWFSEKRKNLSQQYGTFFFTNLKMMCQPTCDLLVRHHLIETKLSFPVPLKEQLPNNTTSFKNYKLTPFLLGLKPPTFPAAISYSSLTQHCNRTWNSCSALEQQEQHKHQLQQWARLWCLEQPAVTACWICSPLHTEIWVFLPNSYSGLELPSKQQGN